MLKKLIIGAAAAGMMATPALATAWYPGGGMITSPDHMVQHYKGPIGRHGANVYTAYRAFNESAPFGHYYGRHRYYRGY